MPTTPLPGGQVTLAEYGSVEVDLPPSIVSEIVTNYKDRLECQPTSKPGRWRLTANQHVGTVRIGELSLVIKPKMGLRNLLGLMDVEIPSETWRREVVALADNDDLLVVMARLFCVACEDATRRGLRRSYVSRQERLVSPRGRLDLTEMLRRPGIESPIACRFDEHTADTPINQLLRAALGRARRVVGLGPRWQRRLLGQLAEFDEVDAAAQDWSWALRWKPAPMERHYETAVRLGYLLLAQTSLRSRHGATAANAFLLDMNHLFEAWIGRRLREICVGYTVEEQASISLDVGGEVGMRPDLVVRRDSRIVAVADCKYKRLSGGTGRTPDYYQALAYATAYALPDAWLIYARYPGDPSSHEVQVRGCGVRLHTVGIDMTGTTADMVDQLRTVAGQLTGPAVRA